ncbi:MAG: hypothetical protein RMJ45_03235 [Candidatus Calescibacterium sp.]|nr:hypothetical protein [Candidatus Calescibacterium sp.]
MDSEEKWIPKFRRKLTVSQVEELMEHREYRFMQYFSCFIDDSDYVKFIEEGIDPRYLKDFKKYVEMIRKIKNIAQKVLSFYGIEKILYMDISYYSVDSIIFIYKNKIIEIVLCINSEDIEIDLEDRIEEELIRVGIISEERADT